MYVSDAGRLGFIHIQKTGGTTIRKRVLSQLPDLTRHGAKHGTIRDLPDGAAGHFIFAVVRDPYRRLASLYRFRRVTDTKRGLFARRFPSLSVLLEDMVERWRAGDSDFPVSQVEFIDERVTAYRYEALREAVEGICHRAGLNMPDMAHSRSVNFHGRYDWRREMDPRAVDIINDECRADFDAFGYRVSTFKALCS